MTEKTNGRLTGYASVVSTIIVPLVIWLLMQMAEVRGNRFTSKDGQEVTLEISRIWQTIAALPTDVFEAKVDKISDAVHALKLAMEIRLAKLEGK